MDITGPFWMLIRARILKGTLSWKSGSAIIAPEEAVVWLYLPPFAWTSETGAAGSLIEIEGLFSILAPEPHWPKVPCLFNSAHPVPRSFAEASRFLKKHKPYAEVMLQPNASGAVLKVKAILDKQFVENISMEAISRQLKTSSAVVSRQFKASYGFPPMVYKRGLRVTVAMYHLLSGKPAIEAAALAGYDDLGRFYKQFKEYLHLTPESHRVRAGQKTPRRTRKL